MLLELGLRLHRGSGIPSQVELKLIKGRLFRSISGSLSSSNRVL